MEKVVRFKKSCKLRYFRKPTEDDLCNAWYDSLDYQCFRHQTIQVVNSIMSSPMPNDALYLIEEDEEQCSWVGLEGFLPKNTEVRLARRALIRNIVLDDYREDSPEIIAQFCQAVSRYGERAAKFAAIILEYQLANLPEDRRSTISSRVVRSPGESKKADTL